MIRYIDHPRNESMFVIYQIGKFSNERLSIMLRYFLKFALNFRILRPFWQLTYELHTIWVLLSTYVGMKTDLLSRKIILDKCSIPYKIGNMNRNNFSVQRH